MENYKLLVQGSRSRIDMEIRHWTVPQTRQIFTPMSYLLRTCFYECHKVVRNRLHKTAFVTTALGFRIEKVLFPKYTTPNHGSNNQFERNSHHQVRGDALQIHTSAIPGRDYNYSICFVLSNSYGVNILDVITLKCTIIKHKKINDLVQDWARYVKRCVRMSNAWTPYISCIFPVFGTSNPT